MTHPILTQLAQSLPSTVPFVGPEAMTRARSRPFAARLGANENLFGPSPQAVAAMRRAAEEVWMYGDPECHDLKAAIAAHHGVTSANVVVGEGIDGLLGLLVRLVVGAGERVVTSAGAYPTFPFHVAGFGGDIIRVPYLGDHEDPDALVAAARASGAKLIYLANPDNPMGSHHTAATIAAMIDALPEGCLLALDEAYVELAPAGAEAVVAADDPRVIRFRTFSKAHGMAGLRLGYALAAPDLALAFDKVRNHFGVGRIAQAGGIAALGDSAHLAAVRDWAVAGRQRLGQIALANGLTPLPSATNFVTMDCGQDGAYARALMQALIARDIFVRMPGVAPLDRCIRVSLGDDAAVTAFAQALPLALGDLRQA
ncbi:MAG: pyridoxal phosphate-dependent aminotransferase [Pseudomonadota bacterium]